MKSNLAQHPCANKCTNFKDEQCNTCLIKGKILADFITGDVVVLKDLNILCVTDLITLKSFDGQFWETDHRIGRVTEKVIRCATPAELKAKYRIEAPVALFVSGIN